MFQNIQPNKSKYLIFTGGHHTGALAVAQKLKSKGWGIIWVGHRHSQWGDLTDSAEYREVVASSIPFYELKAGKLYRTTNLLKLLRLPLGFLQAASLVFRFRLGLGARLKGIVTFGGYLGVPICIAGWLFRLPIIAHEQTVTTGWANKVISLFARKIAISWPSTSHHYPQDKVTLTGLPFRPEVLSRYNQTSKRQSDLIYITGGKQGSHTINLAVFSVLPSLLSSYYVVHQTGSSSLHSDYTAALKLRAQLSPHLARKYSVIDYLSPDSAARYLSSASVVVSRSGAHIVQELALFKSPAVLIPIPWSSHDEQNKNAQVLVHANQAVLLPQTKLSGDELLSAISSAAHLTPRPLKVITTGLENLVHLIETTFT